MAQPNILQYFVQTDVTFGHIFQWMTGEKDAGRLQLTGSGQIQLDHIYSNNPVNDMYWGRVYDFSRTTAATLRYLMLKITGVIGYYTHNTTIIEQRVNADLSRPGQEIEWGTPINDGNFLANDGISANWVAAHFDMMFPHFLIESRIQGACAPFQLFNQMIVINRQHGMVWNFLISLNIRNINYEVGMYEAIPLIVVYRLEPTFQPPQIGPQLQNYPYSLPSNYDGNMEYIKNELAKVNIRE